MNRKAVPKDTQNRVLLDSRRRCCICFGLNRNTDIKSGQIAHLDKNNNNNDEENLAFLCFDHHDEYDSVTSQRKSITIGEVKEFRSELYRTINKAFTQKVHFGDMSIPPDDPFAGQYIRMGGDSDSAEISLTPLPDSVEGQKRYFVSGFALWGVRREYGPHMGILEFVGEIDHKYSMRHDHRRSYQKGVTILAFDGYGRLKIEEDNVMGEYGMNVTFVGQYQRAY